ncbi:MAG: nucleotide disphospho-sugar-binding domain-containing protein, partial [Cyanobacteria bacterium P01_F01_bin.153]
MTHYGLLCPPSPGHLNPSIILAQTLMERGHRVTLFTIADMVDAVESTGVDICCFGQDDFPSGSVANQFQQLGELSGVAAVKFTVQILDQQNRLALDEIPILASELGVEGWIMDQVSGAGRTIADRLQQPFATVCNALPVDEEPAVPPPFRSWSYKTGLGARLRNSLGYALIRQITRPLRQTTKEYRQRWGLPILSISDRYSPLARVAQLPKNFDFPRQELSPWFHYTGPFQRSDRQEPLSRSTPPFPFEKLDDRPLVYASLGTLQNQLPEIFQAIATACEPLNVQLVISLGRADSALKDIKLPGNPIVVTYAPQQQLIDRAAAVVTHAGMNATLSALSAGVPLVAIPIANEQPGIAARIAYSGAGLKLELKELKGDRLQNAIQTVLSNPSYRQKAQQFQQEIQ